MQNWAKRGFQTALVTGGLLMLGTGIASANENVDPDAPVSPIDGSITIPFDISNNAFGGPDGQHDAPEFQETLSTRDVTDPIKEEFEANLPEDDPFRGNRINADLVVPVQITNNAVAFLGDAEVSDGDSSQSYDGSNDVETSGTGEVLGGNVIDLDWAAPIQIANNAAAAPGGTAKTSGNNAEQDTKQGGDATTDGSGGVLSGNVLAGHWATPLQGNNNAIAWGGTAESEGNSSGSTTESGGAVVTDGTDGVGSGNAGAGPLAAAGGFNNNAASWIGIADSHGADNTVDATAGGSKTGINDIPSYVQTKGDGGMLSGNIVQPQGAGNGTAHGNAGTWIGTAATGGGASRADGANSHDTSTDAGGFSSTSGTDSVGSGNMADAPVALPVEAFCVAGSWIGIAEANCESTTTADSGWGTFTDGTGSVGGGNSAHVPIAGTAETFGIGGTWIGSADAVATEDKDVSAGGYNGTRGDDSTLGGNLVQVPVAEPVEAFGIGGAWGGSGSGTASETKTVTSGGDNSTIDDNGNGSSNIVAVPVSAPVQAFGIGGAWIGEGHGTATADTESSAGGYSKASGPGGVLSGNIVQGALATPVQGFGSGAVWGGTASGTAENSSTTTAGDFTQTDGSNGSGSGNIIAVAGALPTQAHGLAASWIGIADGASVNTTEAAAGGDSTTDGTAGSFSGNVVPVPVAGAVTGFGSSATFIGQATGLGSNDVVSTAGGDTTTAGDEGSVSGNVLSAQGLPIAQGFGNAASVLGIAGGEATNTTDSASGGDITTSGEDGSLSGNIFDLPVAAVAQVFGNAGTIGGIADAIAVNNTTGTVGGLDTTAGDNQAGSGFVNQVPLGALVQIFGFSGPILGEALGVATNTTDLSIANDVAQINIPIDGAEMAIDGLPSMPSADAFALPGRSGGPQLSPALMPQPISAPAAPAGVPSLPEAPAGVPSLPASPADLPALPADVPAAPALPGLSGLPDTGVAMPLPAPALPGRSAAPALPVDVPAAPALPADVPAAPALPMDVPAAPALPMDVPAAPALPADVPAAPALPADVPAAPALPGLSELPTGLDALPGLPTSGVAMPLPAPALPGRSAAPALPMDVPAAPALPADVPAAPALPVAAPAAPELPANVMPQVQPGQVNAGETGFRGMFAKFFGLMTGKPFSVQS